MYYAAVPGLLERLERERPADVRALIVDVSHAHQLRYSALEAFEGYAEHLRAQGVRLILVGASARFRAILDRAKSPLERLPSHPTPGMSAHLGLDRIAEDRVFPAPR